MAAARSMKLVRAEGRRWPRAPAISRGTLDQIEGSIQTWGSGAGPLSIRSAASRVCSATGMTSTPESPTRSRASVR